MHALHPNFKKGMEEIWALQDINFEIMRGEAVAIIGRNGGGKSTLLEILTGTLTPTTGSVKVKGRVSALLELGSGFNPEYSGRENVILNGLLLGLSKEEIVNRFPEIEAFAEIGEAIERPVKTYSSGMMMRLAFAVQVLCDPDILIIDEALSVGDFFFQQKSTKYLQNLIRRGVTVLLVSHDMSMVQSLCQRIIFLDEKKVAYDGDIIQGINRFYTSIAPSHRLPSIVNVKLKDDDQTIEKNYQDIIKNAIWTRKDEPRFGSVIAISLCDINGYPQTSFVIGEKIRVAVLFQPDPNYRNAISISICDKHGAIVNATNSISLGIMGDNNSNLCAYESEICLLLEASKYRLIFDLYYEQEKNRGITLDHVNNIDLINIAWDYENKNAPFLGKVGLPVVSKFY
jgi:lipopolysaccharide transport system ATP-binding protein